MTNIYVYALMVSIIEYSKIFLSYWAVCGFKPKKAFFPHLFAAVSTVGLTLLIVYCDGIDMLEISELFIGIIIPAVCFRKSKLNKILLYFVVVIVMTCVDSYVYTALMIVVGGNADFFMNDKVSLLIGDSLILPFLLIVLLTKKSRNVPKDMEELHMIWPQYLLMLVGILCCGIVVSGTQSMMLNVMNDKQQAFMFLAINFACLIFFLTSVWLARVTSSRNFYKKRDMIQQEYISMQDNYFNEVIEKENQSRSFRHDLRSHMIAIQELSNRNDQRNLQIYTQRILDEVKDLRGYCYSGNSVVDAVVSDIMKNVDPNKINLVWSGQLPAQVDIEKFDLCTVFSNLVKNSVEACKKQLGTEVKIIRVHTDMFEGIVSIRITNPITIPVVFNNGRPVSDKKDTMLHGYGLSNIEKTVEKYKGVVKYLCDEDEFTVEVLMHQLKPDTY